MIIGIPIYNDLKKFKAMFDSFIKSNKVFDKIVFIESESTDGSAEYCDELKESYPYIQIEVYHTKKEGPLKAYEKLFDMAKKEKSDLFLTQTDVLFPKCYKRNWLDDMKQTAEINECGIITCYGGGGQSGPDFIDGYNWVGAWCTYIPYRTIEKIGGYDMNIPLGWGVDIEYTYAIEQAGLKVYVINYWVDHTPEYKIAHEHERIGNLKELQQEAFDYMKNKWNIK